MGGPDPLAHKRAMVSYNEYELMPDWPITGKDRGSDLLGSVLLCRKQKDEEMF